MPAAALRSGMVDALRWALINRLVGLAAAALAALPAQAQFSAAPRPHRPAVLQPSVAPNAPAYRLDAARHIYAAYPAQVLKGKVPALVHAIVVTETEIDARGQVLGVRIVRQPSSAREVTPWVVSLIRGASPLPPPARVGRLRFVEVWLVDRSGRFQVHSLTEGQL
jgi:periplasmic protein TonB